MIHGVKRVDGGPMEERLVSSHVPANPWTTCICSRLHMLSARAPHGVWNEAWLLPNTRCEMWDQLEARFRGGEVQGLVWQLVV